jgi:hypothetical protein
MKAAVCRRYRSADVLEIRDEFVKRNEQQK